MREILILIVIVIIVVYLLSKEYKLESYNDYGNCSGSGNNIDSIGDKFSNSKDVYILGKVGISPWGDCPGFLDRQAKWIWFTQNARTTAPGSGIGNTSFIYRWYNTNSSDISAKINIIADNQSYIIVNGKNIGKQTGGWGGRGGLFYVTLQPGTNDFVFNATNLGNSPNPAGLLVSVLDNNNRVLFRTGDNGWKYSRASSESGNSSICPTNYPYQSYGGKICYTKAEYAKKGSGPCESWCTNDKNFGSGCGNPALKLCSKLSVSSNSSKYSKAVFSSSTSSGLF